MAEPRRTGLGKTVNFHLMYVLRLRSLSQSLEMRSSQLRIQLLSFKQTSGLEMWVLANRRYSLAALGEFVEGALAFADGRRASKAD